jgi:hypothetical protein
MAPGTYFPSAETKSVLAAGPIGSLSPVVAAMDSRQQSMPTNTDAADARNAARIVVA